jgi:hypothetical protein
VLFILPASPQATESLHNKAKRGNKFTPFNAENGKNVSFWWF